MVFDKITVNTITKGISALQKDKTDIDTGHSTNSWWSYADCFVKSFVQLNAKSWCCSKEYDGWYNYSYSKEQT